MGDVRSGLSVAVARPWLLCASVGGLFDCVALLERYFGVLHLGVAVPDGADGCVLLLAHFVASFTNRRLIRSHSYSHQPAIPLVWSCARGSLLPGCVDVSIAGRACLMACAIGGLQCGGTERGPDVEGSQEGTYAAVNIFWTARCARGSQNRVGGECPERADALQFTGRERGCGSRDAPCLATLSPGGGAAARAALRGAHDGGEQFEARFEGDREASRKVLVGTGETRVAGRRAGETSGRRRTRS